MADSPLHKSGILMLFPVRRKRVIPWLIIFGVLALFAFGLVVIVKGAYLMFVHPVLAAQNGLNEFMDGDSELTFWR